MLIIDGPSQDYFDVQPTGTNIDPSKNNSTGNSPGPGCLTWIAANKYASCVLKTLGHKGTKMVAGALFSAALIITGLGGPAGIPLLIAALALLTVSGLIYIPESRSIEHSGPVDVIEHGIDSAMYFALGMVPIISIPAYLISRYLRFNLVDRAGVVRWMRLA